MCELGQFFDLRMVEPRVKGQAKVCQRSQSLAELVVGEQSGWSDVGRIDDARVGVPGGDVSDAAKASAAGSNVRLEYLAHAGAEPHVRKSDNARAHGCRTKAPAGAHRGDAVDELRLADWPQLFWPTCSVLGAAWHEHRSHDFVPARQVIQELMPPIPLSAAFQQ